MTMPVVKLTWIAGLGELTSPNRRPQPGAVRNLSALPTFLPARRAIPTGRPSSLGMRTQDRCGTLLKYIGLLGISVSSKIPPSSRFCSPD